jgi:hypothetical protein
MVRLSEKQLRGPTEELKEDLIRKAGRQEKE